MLETLKGLAASKKFLSAVAGIITLIGVRFLDLPEDQLAPLSLQITGIVGALLLGQGAADLGKEKETRRADGILKAIVTEGAINQGFSPGDDEDSDAVA